MRTTQVAAKIGTHARESASARAAALHGEVAAAIQQRFAGHGACTYVEYIHIQMLQHNKMCSYREFIINGRDAHETD